MAAIQYYDVILKPIVTEKSMNAMTEKKYTFQVHTEANKTQIKEAVEKRGLLNLRTTPDTQEAVIEKKSMDLLISHKVMSETEIRSRYEITLENYVKTVSIEALTMIDMTKKMILPAIESYVTSVANSLALKSSVVPELSGKYEKKNQTTSSFNGNRSSYRRR